MSLQFTHPWLYLITDRQKLPRTQTDSELEALIQFAERAIAAGVDLLQLREKDLPGRQLFKLTETLTTMARGRRTRVLINDRADIAAACPGAGLHLTTRSIPLATIRKTFGEALFIGASTHSLAEARAAEDGGANFIVFGPVFETASKKMYGRPLGLEALREVACKVRIPVLALGGITAANYKTTLEAGAWGLAAISLFTAAEDLPQLVQSLKEG